MPNHCISSNKIVYYTFMVLLHMQCPSGCYAGLSYYLQFLLIPHGSYCVLHASSFISSYVPLHYTLFAAMYLLQGRASLLPWHKSMHMECTSLSQASPTILTGFHFAALRHTFTSVAFSPPAAHNWLALRTHFGCVHLADANCSCRTSISQSIAKVHLHSSAAFVP